MQAKPTIQNGCRVSADHVITDEDGALISSSERDGPMVYIHGQGEILPGIEQALSGCGMGDQLKLTLPPKLAYGEHRPELVFEAPRTNLPDGIDLKPGAEVYSGSGDRPAFSLRVLKETQTGVLLDGNHPLAGKTLHVELQILSIQ